MNRSTAISRQRVRLPVSLGKRSYDILIQGGLLNEMGACLHDAGLSGRAAIVTNPNVYRLYGAKVLGSLKRSGFQTHTIMIPEGERAKTLNWTSQILDDLMARRFDRHDILVAVGGGVVGDLTGFAASVYLRGIPFVQVATTLVAQVDSSVGGKTGVNHRLGKNMIGAFYQPRLVLMDTETLSTLPKREWVAGLAEVIKYGMIADKSFFEYLEQHTEAILRMERDPVQFMIQRCCEIKASVVAQDERESGLRRILNYGHTVGHALESLGGYRKLIHGEAVGIGMVQEAAVSNHLGRCAEEVVTRQRDLVRRVGLPDKLPALKFSELWKAMQHDKKVVKGEINCVLPREVGRVEVVPLERQGVGVWFRRSQGNIERKTTNLGNRSVRNPAPFG